MGDIAPQDWNRLATGASPFLSWEFLSLLEESGALDEAAWRSAHALVYLDGVLVACAPFYLAPSSAGQFTWDDGMEGAASTLEARWFPKLVGMVPFTPDPVWRVLSDPAAASLDPSSFLLASMEKAGRAGGFSGIHLQWVDPLFSPPNAHDWIQWRRQSYRWENRGWRDFNGYLASFSKNMRRNALRDRAAVASAGVETRIVPAADAPPAFWRLMETYYSRTNDKFGPWAARFLPPAFFELCPSRIAPMARFSAAFRRGEPEPIALAFLIEGSGGLWGRYWGSASEENGLHFEICYYRPIEYAIERGLGFFDPGMGGRHKARRGFGSATVVSYHRVFDARLAGVFADAVADASADEDAFTAELNGELPFKGGIGPSA